ncbi:MAG: energy-coupling factor transporter transmembrane protein EcfT [Spirochaetaceae bacterium]|nr:energy-coupling factor transporter transmembrane protein EcfT [Spirochaetaceae bacterium]
MHIHDFTVMTKAVVFFCVMIGTFLAKDLGNIWIITVSAIVYLAFQRHWRHILTWGLFFGFLSLLLFLMINCNLRLKFISEFHLFIFWRMTPVFIVAWDIISTPPGNLSAFLSRLNARSDIILGMLVIFRFFPTMKTSFGELIQSMRNRGIFRLKNIIRHPLFFFQYIFVPILLRCLQIADQLAISAIARGIEAPAKRENYYKQKTQSRDCLCMLVAVFGLFGFLLMEGID